jgi:hypothetical protein
MEAFKNAVAEQVDAIDLAQRMVQKLHAEAGYTPEQSRAMRLKIAKKKLAKTLRFERKTEPYRTRWQAQCEALRMLVEKLEAAA